MTKSATPVVILALLLAAGLGACGSDDPVGPRNHDPILLSLTTFPAGIGPADSVILICNAMDPDADTLVYDWGTDLRLRIKGAPSPIKSNTSNNAETFYPTYQPLDVDTLWVGCTVRDRRGGAASRAVSILLHP